MSINNKQEKKQLFNISSNNRSKYSLNEPTITTYPNNSSKGIYNNFIKQRAQQPKLVNLNSQRAQHPQLVNLNSKLNQLASEIALDIINIELSTIEQSTLNRLRPRSRNGNGNGNGNPNPTTTTTTNNINKKKQEKDSIINKIFLKIFNLNYLNPKYRNQLINTNLLIYIRNLIVKKLNEKIINSKKSE